MDMEAPPEQFWLMGGIWAGMVPQSQVPVLQLVHVIFAHTPIWHSQVVLWPETTSNVPPPAMAGSDPWHLPAVADDEDDEEVCGVGDGVGVGVAVGAPVGLGVGDRVGVAAPVGDGAAVGAPVGVGAVPVRLTVSSLMLSDRE